MICGLSGLCVYRTSRHEKRGKIEEEKLLTQFLDTSQARDIFLPGFFKSEKT